MRTDSKVSGEAERGGLQLEKSCLRGEACELRLVGPESRRGNRAHAVDRGPSCVHGGGRWDSASALCLCTASPDLCAGVT